MRLFRPERLSSEKRRKFLASDIYIYGKVGSARKANPGQCREVRSVPGREGSYLFHNTFLSQFYSTCLYKQNLLIFFSKNEFQQHFSYHRPPFVLRIRSGPERPQRPQRRQQDSRSQQRHLLRGEGTRAEVSPRKTTAEEVGREGLVHHLRAWRGG